MNGICKSLLVVSTLVAAAPHANAEIILSKGASKSDSFGGSQWAAGYSASARVTYERRGDSLLGVSDNMRATASLRGWVRMFGDTFNDVLVVKGSGLTTIGGAHAYEVEVFSYVPYLGKKVELYSNRWTGSFTISKTWTPVVASAWAYFTVGPVPVSVRASAKARVGFSVTGYPSATNLAVTFKPRTGSSAELSAGVDLWLASVGVYGDLNLFDVSLPVTSKIGLNTGETCRGFNWSNDVSLAVKSLDGEVGVFAELLGERWKLKLVGWNGFSTTFPIYDANGTVCF